MRLANVQTTVRLALCQNSADWLSRMKLSRPTKGAPASMVDWACRLIQKTSNAGYPTIASIQSRDGNVKIAARGPSRSIHDPNFSNMVLFRTIKLFHNLYGINTSSTRWYRSNYLCRWGVRFNGRTPHPPPLKLFLLRDYIQILLLAPSHSLLWAHTLKHDLLKHLGEGKGTLDLRGV